jgi:hypothetical protein
MKKLLVVIAVVAVVVQTAIAGFGVSASGSTSTNAVYAARAGQSADFQSFASTNTVEDRIAVANTNWLAQMIAETNRAIVAEAILITNAVVSSRLSYTTPYATQTVAGVFTNVYDAKGLSVSRNP